MIKHLRRAAAGLAQPEQVKAAARAASTEKTSDGVDVRTFCSVKFA
jgi:hypothetical protein